MPSASFYAPVQSAINNLNQQLNINAAREAERERRGLQRLMTHDDLLARQQQRHLAQKADARADQQLDLAMQEAARVEDMREFRRLMAIKQDKRAAERWALESPSLKLKKEMTEEQLSPSEMNIYQIAPLGDTDWLSMEGAQEAVEQALGGSAKVDPTSGSVYDVHTGEPLAIPKWKIDRMAPGLAGIALAYNDPERQRAEETREAYGELKAIQSEMKRFTDNASGAKSGRFKAQIAQLKQKENAMKKQVALSTAAETPMSLYNDYRERGENLRKATLNLIANGARPEAIQFMQNAINNNAELQKAMLTLQGKTAGSESTISKMAINPKTGETRWINVPKNAPGALTPFVASQKDPAAQNMVWIDGIDKLTQDGKSYLIESTTFVDDYINSSRSIIRTLPEQQEFAQFVKNQLARYAATDKGAAAFNNETRAIAETTRILNKAEEAHNMAFTDLAKIANGYDPETNFSFEELIEHDNLAIDPDKLQEEYSRQYRDQYAKQLGYIPTAALNPGAMTEYYLEKYEDERTYEDLRQTDQAK